MKHSWLKESVDRVLAEAPHMSDAHKRKLVEAVGLELARAWARGRSETKHVVNTDYFQSLTAEHIELPTSVEFRDWIRQRKQSPDAVVVEVSPAVEPPTALEWDSLNAYVKDRYGGKG